MGGWVSTPPARPLLVTLYRSGLVQLNKAAAGAAQAMNTALRVNLVQSGGEWYLVRRDNPLDNALSYTFGGPAKFYATKPVRAFLRATREIGLRCNARWSRCLPGQAWPFG